MPRSRSPVVTVFLAALAAGTLFFTSGARAQGLIESFFNSLGHVLRHAPERVPAFAEPLQTIERAVNAPDETDRAASGPAKAFCVRTCDGHYFPVRAHAGMSAAQACQAFCPASQTRLYTGGTIDYAVGRDGSRYADLPTAYVYRQHLVAGCTCNGRNHFGLARIDAANDPTLRPGDVVATPNGMVAFNGRKDDTAADFTPAASYPRFSKSFREQLSALKVMPANSGMPSEANAPLPPEQGHDGSRRSAQR